MDDLIYNQTKIPKSRWRYGFRSSAATGCGWIAVYNGLRLMGYRVKPEGLIRYFERQLPLVHGNTGTSIWGPWVYFRKWGFPAKMSAHRREFDDLAKQADVCVVFYRWRRGYRLGAHFAALHHTEAGFLGYNTFKNSSGPDRWGSSIPAFLKRHRYFCPVLICIQDKKRKDIPNDIA